MVILNIIETIDLWTEQKENNLECFSGAFVDGFENRDVPFDSYKVVKNCNCIITTNEPSLNISSKHNAIIFYKRNKPVRLMIINRSTDVDRCIDMALNQLFDNRLLKEIYTSLGIKRVDVDLKQKPLINEIDHDKEIDVSSCDRPSLLNCMLEGSYTESETNFGKSNSDINYRFLPNTCIKYELDVKDECFIIQHHCAFLNEDMTRIIPLQDNSLLDIEEISSQFSVTDRDLSKNGGNQL